MKQIVSAIAAATTAIAMLTGCGGNKNVSDPTADAAQFVRVDSGRFMRGDSVYKFVGTNFWYGPILASEGRGGDRNRLTRELNMMQAAGINNLRILAGAQGPEGIASHIEPALQLGPGEYNDTLLAGLDYLLAELEKRDMLAVIYLNNAWEWSGGYGSYLQWAGEGPAPVPAETSYQEYMDHVSKFLDNDSAKALFTDHLRFIVGRTNTVTGKPYAESPAIMSWQIANEPRAFADSRKTALRDWLRASAAEIRKIDPNHMVSTGSEGSHGCEQDLDLWTEIHSGDAFDYANIHIWPYNWGWVNDSTVADSSAVATACRNTLDYIRRHHERMAALGKPVVLEEFGYPRDGMSLEPGSPTTGRDKYYRYVFDLIAGTGMIAGCNFWAWGGYGMPAHATWQPGDPYTGDPAQEGQGLNSVFAADSTTLRIITDFSK